MPKSATTHVGATVVIEKSELRQIFQNLLARGFTVVGPSLDAGAVKIKEISDPSELPIGIASKHGRGSYRLTEAAKGHYFSALPGSPSWREFVYPPRSPFLRSIKSNGGWTFEAIEEESKQYAFVGIRPCDLAALGLDDQVFLENGARDPNYEARRRSCFVLVANCVSPVSTCFCTSLKGSPRASTGFDLALTELPDFFVVELGSEIGTEMLEAVEWRPATAFDLGKVRELLERSERQIERKLETEGLEKALIDSIDSPVWDELGAKCLSCGNCTFVCPTCFCSTVEEHSELRGTASTRERTWDSCYSLEFSHVAGGNIRPTTSARHRQWVMHKFALSVEQFDRPACVGCGRCITWCPVGIDVTAEVGAIRAHGTK